jgi:hypothetical protein
MIYLLILTGFLAISAVLLSKLGKLAERKGEAPRTWQLYALMAWGFMWLGERLLTEALGNTFPGLITFRWAFVVMMFAGCWGIYLFLWDRLNKRPDRGSWQRKVDEIGEEIEVEED